MTQPQTEGAAVLQDLEVSPSLVCDLDQLFFMHVPGHGALRGQGSGPCQILPKTPGFSHN